MSLAIDAPAALPTCTLAGIPVARLSFAETVDRIASWLREPGCHRVATANLDFLRLAASDAKLRRDLSSSSLVTADGWPLVALSRLHARPIPERVAGSDLLPALAARAARDGVPVYFLGGAPGAAEETAKRLRKRNPGLRVVGCDAPFLDWSDSNAAGEVADRVAASGAQLLFVALGCPRQEAFLAEHLERTGCRVGIGVGGSFDFVSGRRARAPRWLQRLRLEWAFRLSLEPRRLVVRYLLDAGFLMRSLLDARGLAS